jgi:hypothetical protein
MLKRGLVALILDTHLGNYSNNLPSPHDANATTMIAAGPITVGLEYRGLDPVTEMAIPGGICLHVFATDTMAEYLRFDCFRDRPHYHYIVPGDGNVVVRFDEAANGPALDWALTAIRFRLRAMLTLAGAETLAAEVDDAALATAVEKAGALARSELASRESPA